MAETPGRPAAGLASNRPAGPIDDRLAALSSEQRQLVEIALARRAGPGDVELSFPQEGIWFSQQLDPVGSTFNNPVCLEVRGRLDLRALERAMTAVVRRHEPLRAVFRTSGGRVIQRFGPPPTAQFEIPVEDLSGLNESERVARERADEEAVRPFDLGQGPTFRARILRMGREHHHLFITLHHLVSDGWSLGVLLAELRAGYAGAAALPPLVERYRDYVERQRREADRPEAQSRLRAWCDRLAGVAPRPEFRVARPGPADSSFRGDRRPLSLSRDLVAAVTRVAAAEGATFSMAVLSAWAEVLTGWTGRSEHLIGVPEAGRTRPELEPLIGTFVNVAVCRVNLIGASTRRESLRSVRRVLAEALDHQDVPFARVVRALRSRADGGAVPSAVVVQNTPWPVLRLGDADLQVREANTRTARFGLELHVWPWPTGYRGWLYYRIDQFYAATADRMIADWIEALEGFAARPDEPWGAPGAASAAVPAPSTLVLPPARVPPRTDLERALGVIWRELLGLGEGEVLVDVPFFDSGGHSLLLVELQERIRVGFGRTVPILDLLTHPTIAELARYLGGDAAALLPPPAFTPAERARAQRATLAGRRASHEPG